MAEDFAKAVEDGLKLSKRIYYGKDRAVVPPRPPAPMHRSGADSVFLPTSPMMYAVVSNPAVVDNPDMPSYQPHVHGRCDPPALIPLHMNRIDLEADCYLDTAFVQVSGSWRVHCVMGSKTCDCRIAIPMGEQGSILGVEVEIGRMSYCTQLVPTDDKNDAGKEGRLENGGYLKSNIFTITIPKVDGGSTLSIKLRWMQKLLFQNGEFSLVVPFNFPEYVTPPIKKLPKKEKIQLNVSCGAGTEIFCKTTSHPLKQLKREAGKLGFLYESDVLTWGTTDLSVSYSISSSDIFGCVLLRSPSVDDVDQREMFFAYLFPGDQQRRKVFRKEIVYVIDISGSMEGKPLDATKKALSVALSELDSGDSFNIIGFNGETYQFSSSMESATEKTVARAVEWMNLNFIAGGSTNILHPLNQAIEMVSTTGCSIPIIFLVTDGTVDDERHICNVIERHLTGGVSVSPRIHTFGIGTYCNHHFLRMLATIGRGQYDAAYDVELVESRMQQLFSGGSSPILANIAIDAFVDLNVEVYPSQIPDLSSTSPLTISGRYQGNFPDTLKVKGVAGDMSDFVLDLKTQNAKDMPIDRVFAKQQIDLLTAQAWFSENKQIEEKVAKMSIQTGVVSEYTRMALVETEKPILVTDSPGGNKLKQKTEPQKVDSQGQRRMLLRSLCVGFGNLTATVDNLPPGVEEAKLPEAAEIIIKAASNCCGSLCNRCCCMCCIQCCTRINDQFAIVLTQLCSALACFACMECCSEVCCSGGDGN